MIFFLTHRLSEWVYKEDISLENALVHPFFLFLLFHHGQRPEYTNSEVPFFEIITCNSAAVQTSLKSPLSYTSRS